MGAELRAGHLIRPVCSPNVSFPAIHSLTIFTPWVSKECGDLKITSGLRLGKTEFTFGGNGEEGQRTMEEI